MLQTQNSNNSIRDMWSLIGEYYYQDHPQVYQCKILFTISQVFNLVVRKGGVAQRSKTTEAAGCQTEWGKLCGQFVD